MRVLTIKVEEPKKAAKKLLEILEKATRGEPLEKENTLTFPSVERLFKTLTPARWEVVKALQTKEFQSIRELAKYLKRDYANVWRDVQILNDLGIVEIEETEKGHRAYIPYDRIVLEFPKTVEV
jgi:predicted transcriptional regulator